MTNITFQRFTDLFPEFEAIKQSVAENEIAFASDFWSKSKLGKYWERIVCLYVAHRLALRFNQTSEAKEEGFRSADSTIDSSMSASTSSLSISKTANGMVTSDDPLNSDLARTNYGLELLGLLRIVMPRGRVV